MRLGVKVGKGCAALLDAKMQNLPCQRLEFDEVWGFIGKKQRHTRTGDDPQFGDVWTFWLSTLIQNWCHRSSVGSAI